ncbi:hypothetical protein QTP88_015201 [Uroleucon formosanum]
MTKSAEPNSPETTSAPISSIRDPGVIAVGPTDLMLQVFEELRKNRPKPLQNHSLAGSRLNRGVSLSMPNMAVLQSTPAAPTESEHVSSVR